jgi:hypothetical protein
MEDQYDDVFIDDALGFTSRFGEAGSSKNEGLAQLADDSDQHRFLEEMRARDQDFLSIMRQYEHLVFTCGPEEARIAAKELAGGKLSIKKKDIISMFGHAGGWKIGNLERAGLMRVLGNQTDGELIDACSFQEFLLTTSIGKNTLHDAFQPKLPCKFLSVIINGFPVKTSIAYVNSFCSEYGSIRSVRRLDVGSKHSKHPSLQKFVVTYADEHSASRAVLNLNGFSSKRIPGPLSCQLLPEEDSLGDALASSATVPN